MKKYQTFPPLPRKNNRAEARITPRVIAWFEKNHPHSCAIEIKVGKNKPLPHQVAALRQVESGSFFMKLADTGRRQPFDVIILKNADAFVVYCEGRICDAHAPDGTWKFRFTV